MTSSWKIKFEVFDKIVCCIFTCCSKVGKHLQISPVKVGANTAVQGKNLITFLYQQKDELAIRDKHGEGLNLSSICVNYFSYFEDRGVGCSTQLHRCAVTALSSPLPLCSSSNTETAGGEKVSCRSGVWSDC